MTNIHANNLPDYPVGAPYRRDDASKDGAIKVNTDGSRVTQLAFALAAIERAGSAGVDAYRVFNLPDAPFRDLSTCRARLSDLKAQGKIAKKGERTPGEAGVSVNLWIAARFVPVVPEDQSNLFGLAA